MSESQSVDPVKHGARDVARPRSRRERALGESARRPARRAPSGAIAVALRAFEKGEFERAASELAHCRPDDDPATQLRIAEEMESVAHTALELGERMVRLDLTEPSSPAAKLGERLLGMLEPSLTRLREQASGEEDDVEPAPRLDPAAPPDPGSTPDDVEGYLAARVAPPAPILRAPFGALSRKLHLVERDHHGYDIWWGRCFFAVPRGRSPHPTFYLVCVLDSVRRSVLRPCAVWLRAHLPRSWRRAIRRWLPGSSTARPAGPRAASSLGIPLLRLRAARTGLELQQLLLRRRRKR